MAAEMRLLEHLPGPLLFDEQRFRDGLRQDPDRYRHVQQCQRYDPEQDQGRHFRMSEYAENELVNIGSLPSRFLNLAQRVGAGSIVGAYISGGPILDMLYIAGQRLRISIPGLAGVNINREMTLRPVQEGAIEPLRRHLRAVDPDRPIIAFDEMHEWGDTLDTLKLTLETVFVGSTVHDRTALGKRGWATPAWYQNYGFDKRGRVVEKFGLRERNLPDYPLPYGIETYPSPLDPANTQRWVDIGRFHAAKRELACLAATCTSGVENYRPCESIASSTFDIGRGGLMQSLM